MPVPSVITALVCWNQLLEDEFLPSPESPDIGSAVKSKLRSTQSGSPRMTDNSLGWTGGVAVMTRLKDAKHHRNYA